MLNSSHISFEKYRSERSGELCAAVDITTRSISVVFYDLALSRRVGRTALVGEEVTSESLCAQLSRIFMLSSREYGISAVSLKKIGFAAPVHLSYYIEEQLTPTELFLRPETEIYTLPAISASLSGRFTAVLAAVPQGDCFAADFGSVLCLSGISGSKHTCAAFSLSGAFDGSALESGMPCERGAIDEVSMEKDGTVCYGVISDADSLGIAASGAMMAAKLMLSKGVLDCDGILTDRDLFYIGEDFYVSQADIRYIQADKARCSAALELFMKHTGGFQKAYLSGDVFSAGGMEAMLAVGAIPDELRGAGYAKNAVEQGIIRVLEDENERARAEKIAADAEDITEQLVGEVDELCMERMSFEFKA